MILLLIFLAGGTGALSRFVVDGLVRTVLGRKFPWGTMIINMFGSLLLGLVVGYTISHGTENIELVIGTGFCGGFTTFSTASFETVRLIESKRYLAFTFQLFGNAGLSVALAFIGLILTK